VTVCPYIAQYSTPTLADSRLTLSFLSGQDEPPPPPPAGGFADSDDDNDRDGEGGELDASGKALSKLIGKQEDTLDGGISDDSDDDDEFVDPDQEGKELSQSPRSASLIAHTELTLFFFIGPELHPFLLQQRDKQKAAQSAAAAAAAVTTAPAVMKPLQPEGGVKRSRSEDDVVGTSPVGRSAKTAKQTAKPDNATGSPNTARPIELALREILKKGGKPTTKDVTKQLRKRGLLNSDADKQELKETIGRVARIRKEGNASVVVLQ
jgi:transcription initiation factor TFIIF subunit alpha|tara:strand:- start:1217 stop:2011 length:795 start_codon:yes stop_codon:yes gene_type:complete